MGVLLDRLNAELVDLDSQITRNTAACDFTNRRLGAQKARVNQIIALLTPDLESLVDELIKSGRITLSKSNP